MWIMLKKLNNDCLFDTGYVFYTKDYDTIDISRY